MEIPIPELVLLELEFRALMPINNLPHYHGAHWAALFKNILKAYPSFRESARANIRVQTVETGVSSYGKDETIRLGLAFPAGLLPQVSCMLGDFNGMRCAEGHFQPNITIRLEGIQCRVSGATDGLEHVRPLTENALEDEINALMELDGFSIYFYSPLRLTRPKGYKADEHRYCDADFFLACNDKRLPMAHLLKKITEACASDDDAKESADHNLFVTTGLTVAGGALQWLDVPYGNVVKKTLGGAVGKILVEGRATAEEARLLVTGQYAGVGKNRAFGFGLYSIPELDHERRIRMLTRGATLLSRAVTQAALQDATKRLKPSSPGPDTLTLDDIKKAGAIFFKDLGAKALNGTYKSGNVTKYKLPKDNGSFREILVQNVADRVVHRAIADFMSPIADALFSGSSYAYRKGLNRKGAAEALRKALSDGYTTGIKADISAFFDSVDVNKLMGMLEGIFPFEPLVDRIRTCLTDDEGRVKGLPHGSPLSPVLSNLYLNCFDRDMEKEGFRLVRYADDFMALYRSNGSDEYLKEKVRDSLSKLGLELKAAKTEEVRHGVPVRFLGYMVTADSISEAPAEKTAEEQDWPPVFKDEWHTGIPVYITSISRGAYSDGPALIVKSTNDREEKIPWARISRLVIVGRSPFSGGIIYRAVKEEIPITFIDIMGRARGVLHTLHDGIPELASLQAQNSQDKEYCLAFAREIISAKIHNSAVILRRNSIDATELKEVQHKIKNVMDIDALRGHEGDAARVYFGKFAELVKPFEFRGRAYHPPEGAVNVMLSFGYTLIYNRLVATLRTKGFNVKLGFLHKGRGTHCALASDLMEELRHIVERVVLSLIHREEIKEEDFTTVKVRGVAACRLTGEGFRKFIRRFETTMATKSSYHGGARISLNCYLDEMADGLKRSLRLDIPYKALLID